ncbi:hypothetical protein WK68_06755 [Burkholderia ubonensis]|nr:hypothetical protein WJ69_20485 [Burkholderia ubonensis]KVO38902.1 hypothetical protein WJ75_11250 [Burkholderia ubonensis]KVU45203.1 hypothetical protein WK68_06755 [Burkholderia ubonensis]
MTAMDCSMSNIKHTEDKRFVSRANVARCNELIYIRFEAPVVTDRLYHHVLKNSADPHGGNGIRIHLN